MKRKIYKGGVDNYPLWWYGQSNRLQNFGDRTNYLIPHGAVFNGNGYYFNGTTDYMEDIYGRHLIKEGTNGLWSQLYLTNSVVPPCGSAVGAGDKLYCPSTASPKITGKFILYPNYCPNLSVLDTHNNQISVFNVSHLTKLTLLAPYANLLSSLDVALLTSLAYLHFAYNQISAIDISNLIELTYMKCHENQLAALDVSNNSKIATLDCHSNQMGQSAVDKVLCDANNWNTSNGTLDISGNTAPSQTGIDAKNDMVNNRGWTVTTD